MTKSDLRSYLIAMRQFLRKTHDPRFRSYLKSIGWAEGEDVVIAFDAETIASLVSRLAYNEASNPCLLAIPHADERIGFRLMSIHAIPPKWGRKRPPAEPINPQATVGMLYSSLSRCDAYVPSEWTHDGLTFSRAPEPA